MRSAAELFIISFVRRIASSLVCLAFAASLHASIPAAKSSQSSSVRFDDARRQPLELTAAPADRRSFYLEFYSAAPLPAKVQRKGGLIHWFSSAVKKTAQKVNFFN
jgi:hypothetical protein